MSKVLYPKPRQVKQRTTLPLEVLEQRPFHVEYTDPREDLAPEWKYYNSETAVKADAWFRCRLLGFRPRAVLYNRDEVHPDE